MSKFEQLLEVWTDIGMVSVWTVFAAVPAWALIVTLTMLMVLRDNFSLDGIVFVIWFGVFTILLTVMVFDMWYRRITGKPKFNWLPGRKLD